MYKGGLKVRTINYVMECKCKEGGFCFYRLEEPNGADTYYALSILNLLGVDFKDKDTVGYLKNMQEEDGSYSSIYSAYYSIKSLLLLNEKPKYNPRAYIQKNIRIYNVDKLPVFVGSIFKPMLYLVDLCFSLKIALGNSFKSNITKFVLAFKNNDNGFGNACSTLIETSQALSILNWLNYPIDSLGTKSFIKRCESHVYGFVNVPNTAPSFLEHIYAGVVTCTLLNCKPRYISHCVKFITGSQNNNGGFSRGSLGISTLENTFYAIKSLVLLSSIT